MLARTFTFGSHLVGTNRRGVIVTLLLRRGERGLGGIIGLKREIQTGGCWIMESYEMVHRRRWGGKVRS